MPSDPSSKLAEPALRLFPVRTDALDPRVLTTDLYIKAAPAAEPILYRGVGIHFTDQDRERLLEQGVEFLYVPVQQHASYRRAMLDRLDRLFHDSETSRAERVRLIRSACSRMIEDVLLFPSRPEAIDAVAEISRQFAEWSSTDTAEFSYLLDMSSHDYYTVTHMVNVGVGCGLLCQELHPGDRALQATLIQGGMLHDIGKRGVPEDLLNKPGRLEPDEWELVRIHPLEGHKLLRENPGVPAPVLEMTRDHHERLDGQGYPQRLTGDAIHMPTRVCTVIDVFDAICSARSYRGPTTTVETLRIMQEGVGTQFDREIFEAWTRVVQRMLARDPDRAHSPAGAEPIGDGGSLVDYLQAPPRQTGFVGTWLEDATSQRDRRRHERFPCNKGIRARFLRLGKPVPVSPKEWVDVRLRNVSRSGLQIQTSWPLSINDVLEVDLALHKATRRIRRLAYVVRVRATSDGKWNAGLSFTCDH